MKNVALWISGSKLFGTETPSSDTDYTGIYRESLDRIILGLDRANRSQTTGEETARNTKDDVDTTEKELRTYIRDAMGGQSYAIEGLFIPVDSLITTSQEYMFMVENRDKLIGDLRPIVSYCKAQAQAFSKKSESINSLDKAIEAIENELHQIYKEGRRTKDYILWEMDLHTDDYCTIETPESALSNKTLTPFYKVGSSRYQMNLPAEKVLEMIKAKRSKYGKRAEDAVYYDGKAYSHAFRLAYQYKRLVSDRELIFPLPEADFLRKVKLKEFSKEFVQEKLEEVMTEVLSLPETVGTPDAVFWSDWILETYRNDV